MKMRIKNYINYFCFMLALAAALFSGCSCSTPKPTSDPLAGFHWSSLGNLDSNKIITDDCRNYIQKLSSEENKSANISGYFEDGTGQHAVKLQIGVNGTEWIHVLIYDKDDKRIKAIKYPIGHYAS